MTLRGLSNASLLLLLALGSADTQANGLPFRVVPLYPAKGGIAPLEEDAVRLVSERLRISADNPSSWQARAEYVLENKGPQRVLRFGVPLVLTKDFGQMEGDEGDESYRAGAATISVALGSKRHRCELVKNLPPWVGLGLRSKELVKAWCVTRLEIPHGDAIQLTLEYRQDYGQSSKDGSEDVTSRIQYLLWPAGYWRGPAESVSIEVDLGNRAGSAKVVSPPGAIATGRYMRWELKDVDLKRVESVVVNFSSPYDKSWSEAGWVRAPVQLHASASGQLPPDSSGSYGPGSAIDGSGATAWCSSVRERASQTLSVWWDFLRPTAGQSCLLRDFVLVPGFALGESAYRANGRPHRVRLESCDRPEDGFEVSLVSRKLPSGGYESDRNLYPPDRREERFDEVPLEVHVPSGILERGNCARLRVLGVSAGDERKDVCISEFVPRVYCR